MDSSWVCQRCGATVTCAAMDVLMCPMCSTPKGNAGPGRQVMVTEQGFLCLKNDEGTFRKLCRFVGNGVLMLEFYDHRGHTTVALSLDEIAQFAEEWKARHGAQI